ncbi:MAG: hypothetical protein AAGC64_11285 [Bacteroidota bacterium]
MKSINIVLFIVSFLFTQNLKSQPNCDLETLLDDTLIEKIDYRKYFNNIDFLKALRFKKIDFIGFIGKNKKRLKVTFTSISKNINDLNCYLIEGFTTVANVNNRSFKGEFNIIDNFIFTEPMFAEEIASENFGFSVFSFQLKENPKETFTGIFEGSAILMWSRNNDVAEYEDIFDGYDGNRNYQFIGKWTSYKTGNSSFVAWGQNRIPCAGELDIGVGEFSPNPKYYQYGWEDYKP